MEVRARALNRTPALVFVILIGLTASVDLAASQFKLYKNYSYGVSKSEVVDIDPNIYDCSEQFDEDSWLCLDNEKFANTPVEIAFGFIDDSLVSVTIFAEFSSQIYTDFIATLNSKMQLTSLSDGDSNLDIIQKIKGLESSNLIKEIGDFEGQALNNGNITYIFVERDAFLQFFKKAENFADLLLKMDANTRIAEYTVTENDEGAFSIIRFSAPKRQIKLILEKSSKTTEDF